MTTPLRELLAQFGFDFDRAAAAQATQSIAGVIGAAQSLGRIFLAGAVAQGVRHFVQDMVDTGDELDKSSRQLGLSATELTEWRHAARLAGVDANVFGAAMAKTADAAQRNHAAFRQLGVRTRDQAGQLRPLSELFEDAGVALAGLDNETRRAALAQQLWGEQGRRLLPMFEGGREGIAAMRAEVRRLYGTDLDRLAEQSAAASDAQTRLDMVFDAMRTRLALFLLPALTEGLGNMIEWGTRALEAARRSSIFEAALGILGAVAVAAALATIGAWGPPLLMFALVAAAIGVVVLVVEDLITMFRGGRSVIGEFLDSLFGVGTAASVVSTLTEAWEGLTLAVRDAANAVSRFLGLGDDTTTASGDRRATTRGFDASTGISAAEDARRTAIAGAFSGERRDPAELVRLFGPAAAQGEVRAQRPVSVTTSRQVHVGAIHVSGAGDAETVARRTQRVIEDASADDADLGGSDLVPAGAA